MSGEPHLQAVSGSTWVGEAHDAPTPPTQAADTPPPPSGSNRDRAAQKSRPDRALPTDRMKFEKQVEALRVFAALSGSTHGAVTADDLGQALGLSPNTAGLCSGFFKDSGWLTRVSRGVYAATEPLLEFHRHLTIDPDNHQAAVAFLASTARQSWYWDAVQHLVTTGARLPLILLQLSKASNATEHKTQLTMLVEWLEWLGLLRREGDMIVATTRTPGTDATGTSNATPESIETKAGLTAEAGAEETDDASIGGGGGGELPLVAAAEHAEDAGDPVGALVSFHMSVRITAEDAAKLSAEQLNSLLEVVDRLRR
jgi:hypothetical protein